MPCVFWRNTLPSSLASCRSRLATMCWPRTPSQPCSTTTASSWRSTSQLLRSTPSWVSWGKIGSPGESCIFQSVIILLLLGAVSTWQLAQEEAQPVLCAGTRPAVPSGSKSCSALFKWSSECLPPEMWIASVCSSDWYPFGSRFPPGFWITSRICAFPWTSLFPWRRSWFVKPCWTQPMLTSSLKPSKLLLPPWFSWWQAEGRCFRAEHAAGTAQGAGNELCGALFMLREGAGDSRWVPGASSAPQAQIHHISCVIQGTQALQGAVQAPGLFSPCSEGAQLAEEQKLVQLCSPFLPLSWVWVSSSALPLLRPHSRHQILIVFDKDGLIQFMCWGKDNHYQNTAKEKQ